MGADLGFSADELKAPPFIEFVHPDDREATLNAAEDLSAGERVVNFENRYRAKDGSYLWLSWTSVPVPDAGLIYAVVRDVTCERRADDPDRPCVVGVRDTPTSYGVREDRACRT